MPIQIKIEDNKVDNFSRGAKDELKKQLEKYGENIIKESNLIEEAIREDGAKFQVKKTITNY